MGKIKFKLSVKELSFEFEGDQETGLRFQSAVNKTLNSLADTPNNIIDVESRVINDENLLLPSSTPRKRRKSKRVTASNGSSENGEMGESDGEKRPRTHRSRANSGRSLIIKLIQADYFSTFRSVSDVLSELEKKGHRFDQGHTSTDLLRLTQKDYLIRDNSSGNWQYKKGTVDVPTES